MFDLGLGELLVIGFLALIIVGPKELPGMFRTVGRFMGKARAMAREFSHAMESAADDSGVKDIQKTLKSATDPVGSALKSAKASVSEATRPLTGALDLDPDSATGKLARERDAARQKSNAEAARLRAERLEREAAEARRRADEAAAGLTSPPAPARPADAGANASASASASAPPSQASAAPRNAPGGET